MTIVHGRAVRIVGTRPGRCSIEQLEKVISECLLRIFGGVRQQNLRAYSGPRCPRWRLGQSP